MDRTRLHCCLKKVDLCTKRLEKKDFRVKISTPNLQPHFEEFTRNLDPSVFSPADVVCKTHFLKIFNASGKYKGQTKSKAIPPQSLAPSELRSGTRFGILESRGQNGHAGRAEASLRVEGHGVEGSDMEVEHDHGVAVEEEIDAVRSGSLEEADQELASVEFDSQWGLHSGPGPFTAVDLPLYDGMGSLYEDAFSEIELRPGWEELRSISSAAGTQSSDGSSEAMQIDRNGCSPVGFEGFGFSQDSTPSSSQRLDAITPSQSFTVTSSDSQLSENLSVQYTNEDSQVSAVSNASSTLAFRHIQGTKTTDRCCFICNKTHDRRSVPWSAIRQAWFKLNFYIPKSNRVCTNHLTTSGLFTAEALNQIEATKQGINVKSIDLGLWLLQVSDLPKNSPVTFDDGLVESTKYEMLTGLSRSQFDSLLPYIKQEMRDSKRRTIRNALGMFLLAMRNPMKQELIGHMFSTSQQVVSYNIDSVSQALLRHFVPDNLGYLHITREDAIKQHSIKLANETLGLPSDQLCLTIDCTYVFIETPQDFELQRKTYSLHKHRNLLKFQIVGFTNGKMLDVSGPYFCDSKNNDATIFEKHCENSDFLLFMEKGDAVVWDRGYRDACQFARSEGLKTFMPNLLDKSCRQFTCEEANETRNVTLTRHSIENINGQIKEVYPFFKHVVEGSYVPKIEAFFKVCCALINRFFKPLKMNQEFHEVIIEKAVEIDNNNVLQAEIETKGLQRINAVWERFTPSSLTDFPRLSWDDLKNITLGSYQLKIAQRYNNQHLKNDPEYGIFLHREEDGLIRAKIASRFRKSVAHHLWIRYVPDSVGPEGLQYYCLYQVGARTFGCCAHVASVIRYVGYDIHQPPVPRRNYQPWGVLDCAKDAESEEED